MDLHADGRMAAEADRTLVMAGGLRIPSPLPADGRREETSHRDHRRIQRLAAFLTAGLLVAACSGDGRSTISSPPAAPGRTATTMTRTVPAAPKAPTTAPPTLAPAPTTAADRLAAQLATAETAIRDPATPAGRLPALGRAQQRAYRALVRQPRLVPKVLGQLSPSLRRVVQANVLAGSELRKLNGPAGRLPRWRIVAPASAGQLPGGPGQAGRALEYLAAIHRGGDIQATGDALLAAGRLLRANGAPADMAGALYAYNPSRRYVRAVSAYASQLQANQRAFLGYYHWEVFYGDTLLPEGYPARPPTPAPG